MIIGFKIKNQKSKVDIRTQNLFKSFTFWFILLTFNLYLLSVSCYAQAVSSSELIRNAQGYDGSEIVYEGEVIGEVMQRRDGAWVNISDGENSIGVWMSSELAAAIEYKGSYKAKGDILMILDADITVRPEDLPKFYDALVEGKGEFINGSRLVYPMEDQAMRFLNMLANHLFGWTFSYLLDQRLTDTLCGTKVLFKRDYEAIEQGRAFFGDFDPFGDFDLIFGAVKQNLKVVEIPIRYRERSYGETQISRFRHGWLLLKMTLFAFRKIKAV